MNTYHYKRIEEHVLGLIDSGTLTPGDRLPSLRQMSKSMKVSVPTVSQAYTELESRGIVESRERSGFFIRNDYSKLPACPTLQGDPQPHDVDLSRPELLHAVLQTCSDSDLDYFAHNYPDESLMAGQSLARILRSVVRESPDKAVMLTRPLGYPELRKQLALRAMDGGAAISHKDVIVTSGAMNAISTILRVLTRPGDTVLIQSPTFVVYMQTLEMLGLRGIEIPSCPCNSLSLETVAKAIRDYNVRACLLIPTYHLDGSTLSDETKKGLVELLAKEDVALIEDDVHGDLHFGEERPSLCKKFDTTGHVVSVSSFSKSIAPGFSIGWIIPGRYKKAVARIQGVNIVRPATPMQMAAAEFLRRGEHQRHMKKIRSALASAMSKLHCAVSRHFPEGTSANLPKGGIHLWVRLPDSVDSKQLFIKAREHNVTVIPGYILSSSNTFRNYIRINCRGVWNEQTQQAIATLGRLTAELMD